MGKGAAIAVLCLALGVAAGWFGGYNHAQSELKAYVKGYNSGRSK